MRKKYKHTHYKQKAKSDIFKRIYIKTIVSLIILIFVFLMSDKISGFKKYVMKSLNNSYNASDIKRIREKTIDSTEEIKEAVSVFKEYRTSPDEKKEKNEEIVFRPPYIGEITSVYGERVHPVDNSVSFHTGIDIAGNMGDTIISASPGKVKKVGYDSVNGHYVSIQHNGKFSTSYAHMSKVSVIEGEEVDSNTKIGEIGSSGVSTGAHLHFCIFEDGETIDPEIYIKLNHRN